MYYYPFLSSRAATILCSRRMDAEAMWGRLATCGRLAIGLPLSPENLFATTVVRLRFAALRGRMASCAAVGNRRSSSAGAAGPAGRAPLLLALKRSHINREAVLHIRPQQPLVSFVDLLDRDHFNIRGNPMRPAKIEHLLSLGDAADRRPGKAAPSHNEPECRNTQRLLRRANHGDVAVARQQLNISVDIVIAAIVSRMKSKLPAC